MRIVVGRDAVRLMPRSIIMKKLLGLNVQGVVVAAAVGLGVMTTVNAEEAGDIPTVVVHYGDLNLATPGGAQMLYHRIVKAAAKVCPTASTRDLDAFARARNCQANAVSRAVRQVNSPQLASLHEQRSGHG